MIGSMKKIIPLLGILLFGAGCVTAPASRETSETPKTTYYESADLGLGFYYPNAWGEPVIIEEQGQTDGKSGGCVYQRAVSFPDLPDLGGNSMIVLAAVNTTTCIAPGRGGYWGDNGSTIVPYQAYMSVCEDGGADVCETLKTKNGELVWHYRFPKYSVPFSDLELTGVNEYQLYHDGHPLSGIILSDERLLENGYARYQDELRALVESISFMK